MKSLPLQIVAIRIDIPGIDVQVEQARCALLFRRANELAIRRVEFQQLDAADGIGAVSEECAASG